MGLSHFRLDNAMHFLANARYIFIHYINLLVMIIVILLKCVDPLRMIVYLLLGNIQSLSKIS